MTNEDDDRQFLDRLLEATRREAPPVELAERVLDHVAYRTRLEGSVQRTFGSGRRILVSAAAALAAGFALLLVARNSTREAAIVAEQPRTAGGLGKPALAAASASSS
ncbi:MAG TPA: hypothetical protein VK745_00395, partial [Polyangiaceae bacterium]|nr:hypothetical protein [Polyangiaceae bacterium]